MHKIAKSTIQKSRGNKELDSDRGEVFTIIHNTNDNWRLAQSQKSLNFDIECQNESKVFLRHTLMSPLSCEYLGTENLDTINELNARVVFDNANARWIAICEQLNITEHADDIDSVVLLLKENISKRENVNSNFHLSITLNIYGNTENNNNFYGMKGWMPKIVDCSPQTQMFSAARMQMAAVANLSNSNSTLGAALISQAIESSRKISEGILAKRNPSRAVVLAQQQLRKSLTSLLSAKSDKDKSDKSVIINEFPHIDIDKLARLADEESYTMPQGLTREQIIEWARKNQK